MKLQGKVALITGTSPNICGGIAEGMAEEGAKVVCVDVKPDNANLCADYIMKQGGQAIGVVCDVTNEDHVKAAMERARQAFGGVDILVNGAVIFNQKGVLDMSLEEWTRQTAIILTGTFLFTKYVARLMIDQGRKGNIINIISTAGHQGQPRNVGYCTGKSGLLNFTRSVAMELAEYGIRVNSLTPTATDPREGMDRAARWGKAYGDPRMVSLLEEVRKGVPMQKLPSPQHYARAAVFLASDDAEMITGTDLRVDAGTVARYWAWTPQATGLWQGITETLSTASPKEG
ncbi:MAG TPA: SDR family NAD(P)-dependent oxidoreductase [Candidatus Binatia bacterium]|jgi:NAD(P)-dependent dehydrogenase (short-subunit alcohol dehydrogenase family)|nr:SDR family NAD(P)-dependent oxidoreductase [Candidatus Binatia bacterium]